MTKPSSEDARLGSAPRPQPRLARALAGTRACGLAPALCRPGRVLAAHGRAAFAPAARADMGLALALLLIGLAARLLALGFREVALVLGLALVFRRAGFLERDGDGLLPAFDLAALPFRTALELAMRELVHDAAQRLALARGCFGHGDL